MIQKIQSTSYEIRSHRQRSVVSSDVHLVAIGWIKQPTKPQDFNRARIKKMIWHLQDVLKLMTKLEKERAAKKDPMLDTSSTASQRCSRTSNQEAKK